LEGPSVKKGKVPAVASDSKLHTRLEAIRAKRTQFYPAGLASFGTMPSAPAPTRRIGFVWQTLRDSLFGPDLRLSVDGGILGRVESVV